HAQGGSAVMDVWTPGGPVVVLLEHTLRQGARTIEPSALVCPAQKIPQELSTKSFRVRVLFAEPNVSLRTVSALPVDCESQITPEIETLMASLGSPTVGLTHGAPNLKR